MQVMCEVQRVEMRSEWDRDSSEAGKGRERGQGQGCPSESWTSVGHPVCNVLKVFQGTKTSTGRIVACGLWPVHPLVSKPGCPGPFSLCVSNSTCS